MCVWEAGNVLTAGMWKELLFRAMDNQSDSYKDFSGA